MRVSRSVLFTLCLLAGGLVLAWLTLGLSPTSRRVPLLVIVPLLGLLLLELKRSASETAGRDERSERGLLLWIVALPALVQALGIFLGSALFCLLFFRLRSGESWQTAVTASAIVGFGLWVLFGLLLKTAGGGTIPMPGA